MSRRHGESEHPPKSEIGLLSDSDDCANSIERVPLSCPAHATTSAMATTPEPTFRFGLMFREPGLKPYRPDPKDLIALGSAMQDPISLAPVAHAKKIPAGYVYLGQFIDHDLTFDEKANEMPDGEIDPTEEKSLRSPALDLDSLYGFDPAGMKQTDLGKNIYEDDGIRLRVGRTGSDPNGIKDPDLELPSFSNDLIRQGKSRAMIVDPRNDENLAVAQTHLAFIKFHNAVVEKLAVTLSGQSLFEAARETVVRHYQWIILFDVLPRIIDRNILQDVIESGCQELKFKDGEQPFMPVEFSVAAYRLGHSMISETYEWNRLFQSQPFGKASAELSDLFVFTGSHGNPFLGQPVLPSSWIIDWTRFYDFTGFAEIQNNERGNLARKISPNIISPLMALPPFPDDATPALRVLPVRNLLRGRLLGLPSGQDVAVRLQTQPLTAEEIKENTDAQRRVVLEKTGFDQKTPLWYYILKEAEKIHVGENLGPVGSRILAETFVALIKTSKVSILPREAAGGPVWQPTLGAEKGKFSMPELLLFVQESTGTSFINPLGN